MTGRGDEPRGMERGVDPNDPGRSVDPAVRRKLRRTAWTLAAVAVALAAGAACYIARYGRSSRTVLHSRAGAARSLETA